jgi:hypothetical protein
MPETFSAPLQLVHPAAAAMALNAGERRECRANGVEPGSATSCETPLNIGVFFDGTNNNAERDEPERAHSNVVRLFNAHPAADGKEKLYRPGHYRIYVPGVGTPFKANGELRESLEGKAYGKGGQARILFAVLQVFNSIYRAFQSNTPLFDGPAIAAKLKAFTAQTEGGSQSPETPRYTRDQWLSELNRDIGAEIQKARENALLPRIPEIFVSVFGFSRGAAEAVAFCHWLDKALTQGKIAGMPVRIGLLGLFDCVVSIGLADSGRRAMGVGFSDGHFAWAKEVRLPLPAIVARVVHMSAAHEQRLNFPLTRIRANCEHTEFVYPGMHSDVGGGYMHDSLAGFCLAGYATREERSEKLLEMVEKKARGESLNAHEAQVVANYEEKSKTNEALENAIQDRRKKMTQIEEMRNVYPDVKANAMASYKATSVFKPEENRVIDESGVFPVLTDADAHILYGSGFSKYVLTQLTDGRREGGGYFLPRMVFE